MSFLRALSLAMCIASASISTPTVVIDLVPPFEEVDGFDGDDGNDDEVRRDRSLDLSL
jgi:hypothetical protein